VTSPEATSLGDISISLARGHSRFASTGQELLTSDDADRIGRRIVQLGFLGFGGHTGMDPGLAVWRLPIAPIERRTENVERERERLLDQALVTLDAVR